MADPTNTLAEAAPSPPPAGKVRMLAPNGVVYAVDAASSKVYQDHGYTAYQGPTIDEGSIEAKFGAWRREAGPVAKAAGLGAVNQIPFLDAGLGAVAPDTAKSLAEATRDARAEHPWAYNTGSVAGALSSFAAGGAALKAGAGALKVGQGIAAAAQASPVIAGLAGGAASSAALNVADQIDSAALEHALSPEGQEKVAFSYGDLALAAGLGAVIPGAVGGLVANAGRGARAVERWAGNRLVSEFIDSTEQQALRDVGKGRVVNDILKPLVNEGHGSDHVISKLTSKTKSLALNQENLLAKGNVRDEPLTIKEARGVLEKAQNELLNTPVGHDDLKPLADAVASYDRADAAQVAVSAAKADLKNLGKGASDAARDKARAAVTAAKGGLAEARAGLRPLPKDKELKEIAEKLYNRIDFRDPTGNASYPELLQAGRAVAKGRDVIFERVAPAQQAASFRENRGLLSDHLAVLEGLTKKHIPDVRLALDKAKSSAAISGTLAALGIKGGGILGSAAQGGGLAAIYYGNVRHLAYASQKLAGAVTGADNKLASVIKLGLYGTSVPRVAMHKYDFQTQAARVRAAQRDPATSYGNLHAKLLDKGVPEAVADRVAPRLHAAVQASAMALPPPQNTPDMASAVQPDLHQQRAWLSEHRSRVDPTYALTYPTAQNMAAAKQHHPETIMRAQEAVMEALHKNPYLPLASRMWAARVLGRPAGGLTSPGFYQSLAQMRAKADAEAQQGQSQGSPTGQRGNGPSPVAQSEQSRLGELSTRQ